MEGLKKLLDTVYNNYYVYPYIQELDSIRYHLADEESYSYEVRAEWDDGTEKHIIKRFIPTGLEEDENFLTWLTGNIIDAIDKERAK